MKITIPFRDLEGPIAPADWDPGKYARAQRRVRKMTERELLDWTDVALNGAGKGYMDFRKESDLASLREIQGALMELWALTEELILKAEAGTEPVRHTLS